MPSRANNPSESNDTGKFDENEFLSQLFSFCLNIIRKLMMLQNPVSGRHKFFFNESLLAYGVSAKLEKSSLDETISEYLKTCRKNFAAKVQGHLSVGLPLSLSVFPSINLSSINIFVWRNKDELSWLFLFRSVRLPYVLQPCVPTLIWLARLPTVCLFLSLCFVSRLTVYLSV